MKQAPRPNVYRDAWCAELTAERAGTQARVRAGPSADETTAG
jgi:hypothetical protein